MEVFVILCLCFVENIIYSEAVSLKRFRIKRQSSGFSNGRNRYFDGSDDINTYMEPVAMHGNYPIHIDKDSPFHPDRLKSGQQESNRFSGIKQQNQHIQLENNMRPYQDSFEPTSTIVHRQNLGSIRLNSNQAYEIKTTGTGNKATINIGDIEIKPIQPEIDEFGTIHFGNFKITPKSRSTVNIGGFKIQNTEGSQQFQIQNTDNSRNRQVHFEQPKPNLDEESYFISRPAKKLNKLNNQNMHNTNSFGNSNRYTHGENIIDPRIDRADHIIDKSEKLKRLRQIGYQRKNATSTEHFSLRSNFK